MRLKLDCQLRAATGIPVIFHVHNIYSTPTEYQQEDERRYFENLESWLIRESAAIIPVSDYIGQMCLRLGTDAEKMTVIPKAVHLEEYAGDWQPHDRQTVLFVGRLSPEKGLDTLFAAVALMRDAGTPVRLLVAGTGEDAYVEKLFRQVDELDLRRHVAFLGFVGGRDLVRLYQTSSVTVVPGHMEAFGRVAIEAMAAGAPVVVSDVGGLGPLVRPSETGWRVPAGNPEALAGTLTEALTDQEKASRLAAEGRTEARSLYSWERVLKATVDVYLRVARGR
ncbi:glycosyltransferase family 4 protein [Limnochorda pilosa]|uniref:Glycosyl transferase family 1 n=1 Tax=Limnochorda pilosa TaxID=1555112 RepID=A0A0K2SM06_LIMPI|nr:glycosyltransferase family 4 protein [Limnochorda pilosa]BAS27864.1 glycosyl transferase family 1 [Limnochorda pilosa]